MQVGYHLASGLVNYLSGQLLDGRLGGPAFYTYMI